MGVAASIPNISRYAGGAFGTALLGVVMHAALPDGADSGTDRAAAAVRGAVADGFQAATLVAALFLLAAAAITFRMPPVENKSAVTS
jgi:hypothetical protein